MRFVKFKKLGMENFKKYISPFEMEIEEGK